MQGLSLHHLKKNLCPFSSRLEFYCTNNATEYKALLLGLEFAKEMKFKKLKVVGYLYLIVRQVRSQCATKNVRMKK